MKLMQGMAYMSIWLVLASCQSPATVFMSLPDFAPGKPAKNVILLIGDGMGLSQISAAMYANNNRLTLEEFPYVGFIKTHPQDELITDSAAGATAFACGVKTFNGALGLTADTIPCLTILEETRHLGMASGLIATATIVHATPAAFYAHQDSRISYEAIARELVNAGVDLIIGGGSQYFNNRSSDRVNLYEELRNRNYFVSDYTLDDLLRVPFNPNRGFAYFTAETQPPTAVQNRTYLTLATRYAAKYLAQRNDKGFFLMVEGSQIDWKCHHNEGREVIREILDFDSAVREALLFAKDRDDTLVIVTADHETGGLALNPGSRMGRPKIAFTTNSHTAAMVPVFAYGPSAEIFSGIYENTAIHTKIRQALGLKNNDGHTAGSLAQ